MAKFECLIDSSVDDYLDATGNLSQTQEFAQRLSER